MASNIEETKIIKIGDKQNRDIWPIICSFKKVES